MVAIPPAKDTDAEDVVWGLQTAEALWKRGERIDAIVWLRRAAQAAGEALDDDRALELARSAAELSDWMATSPAVTSPPPAAPPAPPADYDPHNASTFVPYGDDNLLVPQAPGHVPAGPTSAPNGPAAFIPDGPVSMSIDVDLEDAEGSRRQLPNIAMPPSRPAPPVGRPPSSPTIQTAEPYFPPVDALMRPPVADESAPMPMGERFDQRPVQAAPEDRDEHEPSTTTSVPPAERVHAGMFNPWDEAAPPSAPIAPPPPPAPRFAEEEEEVITSIRPQQLAQQRADALASALAQTHPGSEPPAQAPPRKQPPRPPPLPPRARKPLAPQAPAVSRTGTPPMGTPTVSLPTSISTPPTAPLPLRPTPAPPRPASSPPRPPSAPPRPPSAPPLMTPPPPSPTQVMALPERPQDYQESKDQEHERALALALGESPAPIPTPHPTEPQPLAAAASEPELPRDVPAPIEAPPIEAAPNEAAPPEAAPVEAPAAAPVAATPPEKLDLDSVEAFADLPDDARSAFAAAAEVSALGEGEEVSGFALAYILSGTVDVAATMVDAAAARLAAGAVVRSRGTTDEGVPMRLIGVAAGVVATWTDAEVADAFRTCPWVEEDLRTAADRLQTLVGVTIGPLGERLDASIREEIIGRLTMRTLAAGEVVVTAGEQMPGLLLVGVGELELVDGDNVAGVVGSGEFLFPGEVLGGGDAPRTARAGAGGALILFGDRLVAQELLVTCPPLLEVFAGM